MTTVHAYTNDQQSSTFPMQTCDVLGRGNLHDSHHDRGGQSARLGPAGEMAGRLDGMAIRVPTPCVSLVDLVVNLREETTAQAINDVFAAAAAGSLKGILELLYRTVGFCGLRRDQLLQHRGCA